ncbi:MAG TPA: glycosyltransferase [Bryobacteraceae bacterium]|nr:glycosyltransferase [Bryobacteraceae bacterium]
MFWFWFVVAPALLLTLASVAVERGRAAYIREQLAAPPPKELPPATVIVSVKGFDEGLRENLAALASLDYPDYELVIAARSAADIPAGVLPGRAKVVLARGMDPRTSEKIQNLVAAIHAARKNSQILAFADSDGRATRGWLRALAAPLANESVGAATGFRWYLAGPNAGSILRAVWDAVSGGMLGAGNCPFAWGGSMAVRKQVFEEARILEYWKGAVSDDYALTEAVHRAGLTIAYAPGALVPASEPISFRGFLAWSRRQLTITRFCAPRLWQKGLLAHTIYCAAMLASLGLGLRGVALGWWTLAAQLLPGIWKGYRRAALARLSLPEHSWWFRRYGWLHAACVPIATWLWLLVLVCSAFGSTIEWRGYRYDFKNPVPAERV